MIAASVVKLDPDPLGSASPWRIRIRFHFNQICIKLNFTFSRKSQYAVQNIGNYNTSDADENDKTMITGIAMKKKSKFLRLSKMFKT
jgi:hypothetical protein